MSSPVDSISKLHLLGFSVVIYFTYSHCLMYPASYFFPPRV